MISFNAFKADKCRTLNTNGNFVITVLNHTPISEYNIIIIIILYGAVRLRAEFVVTDFAYEILRYSERIFKLPNV